MRYLTLPDLSETLAYRNGGNGELAVTIETVWRVIGRDDASAACWRYPELKLAILFR